MKRISDSANQPMFAEALAQLQNSYRVVIRGKDGTWHTFAGDDFAELLRLPDGTLKVVNMDGEAVGVTGEVVRASGILKVWVTTGGDTRKEEHVDSLWRFHDGAIRAHRKERPVPLAGGQIRRLKRQYL